MDDHGHGWPSIGKLADGSDSVSIALYVGVIGESHRGRDSTERRFQNPGKDHPIEHSFEYRPLLVGLAAGKDEAKDILIGFDAQRRLGKRTRYSMFVPTQLIEAGLKNGWTVGTNAAGEALVAFQPSALQRYFRFRYRASRSNRATEPDMSEISDLLDDLSGLLGLESVGKLGELIATELGGTPTEDPRDIQALLITLANREQLLDGAELTWLTAMGSVAVLDQRIKLVLTLWNELSPSTPIPRSHEALVSRIYEDQRFLGREAQEGMESAIFEVAKCCESEIGPEDLEVFFEDGIPTLFFYESVSSHLEGSSDPGVASDEEDDDEAEAGDDEDVEEQAQPVKASVDKFQVIQVFNLVTKGRLDIEPPWQRKDVWSLKKKRELIKSLILGIPLPSIILHNKQGRMSIIDGKQRLTAIMQFLQNEWKLPNYPTTPDSPLYDCRGVFYSRDGKRSLSEDARDTLELRNIPTLIFEDVPESRLRKIFELYNVTGMKLNAAEIRNAVYQANEIHRVIYVLAGEGDGRANLGIGGLAAQQDFSDRLRHIYPGSTRRYQGVDFLARYLGYSRAVRRPSADHFSIPSTSAAINNFFDHRSAKERPEEIAKELVSVLDGAERFFDLDGERLAFFVRNERGQRQFNKLVGTTHMVAARFLGGLIEAGQVTEAAARSAAAVIATRPPKKQQRATIWDYQARILLGLQAELKVDVGETLGDEWQRFFEKMEYCLLPREDEP